MNTQFFWKEKNQDLVDIIWSILIVGPELNYFEPKTANSHIFQSISPKCQFYWSSSPRSLLARMPRCCCWFCRI
uniref:Uncharacterized protein n=1 Tax=Arundo donax TaxID=35708 RepID=A0A0A8Z991_ARUDO